MTQVINAGKSASAAAHMYFYKQKLDVEKPKKKKMSDDDAFFKCDVDSHQSRWPTALQPENNLEKLCWYELECQ